MPSMKKKSNLHNRVDLRSVGFKSLQFLSFQYYEMSYGLNVEMHKQVRRLLLQKPFSLHCYFNIYSAQCLKSSGFLMLNETFSVFFKQCKYKLLLLIWCPFSYCNKLIFCILLSKAWILNIVTLRYNTKHIIRFYYYERKS